ncbi:MAG: DUF1080 domain-containing protein [Pirellulales bacterium]|nr:DUF1080 domain-containing protein [Pirellulales bacterium]
MTYPHIRVLSLLAVFALALAPLVAEGAAAEKPTAVTPFNGKNLEGWKAQGPIDQSKWTVGVAQVDPANPRRLIAAPAGDAPGELITCEGHGRDLYTEQKFGDCTIEVEVMVPQGSNSGIYVMGEYEIQVLDSHGRTGLSPGDMGGLYAAKGPDVNATKKPGEWQKFVIEFVAPKFKDGKKISNATFVKVTLNDKVIQKDVEMQKQTPGGVAGKEAPEGPLMFQGNHGAVAYRNVKIILPKKK